MTWPVLQPQQGWECPKCGRVYSPATPMCYYCQPGTVTVTTGTGPICTCEKCPSIPCPMHAPKTVGGS